MTCKWQTVDWQKFPQGQLKQISHREIDVPEQLDYITRGLNDHENRPKRSLIETIWGVNSNNNLYEWIYTKWKQYNGNFIYVSCAKLDNSVWGINTDHQVVMIMDKNNQYKNKVFPCNIKFTCISVLKAHHILFIDDHDNIYKGTGYYHEKMDGLLKNISIGKDGFILGVNKNREIYRRDPGKWVKIKGGAVQISCHDKDNAVHVAHDDTVWQRINDSNDEKKISGLLIHISVGKDVCMGVNKQNQIYIRGTSGLMFMEPKKP
jgi:hypothetical protein